MTITTAEAFATTLETALSTNDSNAFFLINQYFADGLISDSDKEAQLKYLFTACMESEAYKQKRLIPFLHSLLTSNRPNFNYKVIKQAISSLTMDQSSSIIGSALQRDELSFAYFFLQHPGNEAKDPTRLLENRKPLLREKINQFKNDPNYNKQLLAKLEHFVNPTNTVLVEMLTPSAYNGDNAIPGSPKHQLEHPVLFTTKELQPYIDRLFTDDESPYKNATVMLLSHRSEGTGHFTKQTDITNYNFSNNKKLQIVARNEAENRHGNIKSDLVLTASDNPNKAAYIRSAKDLVTLSQLKVAKAKVTHKGGYPFERNPRTPVKPYDAYIIDLIGLQFQTEDNTGRLVFIAKDDALPKGAYDDEIFEALVGEKRASYDECATDVQDRYIKAVFLDKEGYIDTWAFAKMVAHQFKATMLALNQQAIEDDAAGISLRFLAYSTGAFAGGLQGFENKTTNEVITNCVLRGIHLGLTELALNKQQTRKIKNLELPYYNKEGDNTQQLQNIASICGENLGITVSTTDYDALEPPTYKWKPGISAATDPHTGPRNEGKGQSVDAEIYEDIDTNGLESNCAVNFAMRERVITTKSYNLATDTEKAALLLEAVEQAASFYKRRTPSAASYKLLPLHSEEGMLLADEIINASNHLSGITPFLRGALNSSKGTTAHSLYSYLAQSLYNVLPETAKVSLEHGWLVSKSNTEANADVFRIAMSEIDRLTETLRVTPPVSISA